jgi:hypothetical protein
MLNRSMLASNSSRLAGYSPSACTVSGHCMRRSVDVATQCGPLQSAAFFCPCADFLSFLSSKHNANITTAPLSPDQATRTSIITIYHSRIVFCYGLRCFLDGRGGPSLGSLVVSQAVPQQILVSIFTLSRLYRVGAHDHYCSRNCFIYTPARHHLVLSDRRC